MKYLPLAARICLSILFFNTGINHLLGFGGFQQGLADQGLPIPVLLAVGTIAFQLIGATLLLLGFKVKWGAILLILFLVPTNLVIHNPFIDPGETTAFFKNLAIIGGLLLIIYTGAGAVSIDEAMASTNRESV
jgi:uncharacterized membrane protein YphA (DoxX/SURF4 family)